MNRPTFFCPRPVLVALLVAAGCRRATPPQPLANSAAVPPSAAAAPATALEVRVMPKTGISILLDGVRVADTAPFETEALASGPHILEVRAMGYHPVTLPLDLAPRQKLTVPVALRPRPHLGPPPRAAEEAPGRSAMAPGARAADAAGANRAPDPAAADAAPPANAPPPQAGVTPLPPGARALLLEVTTDPAQPVYVDGTLVAGRLIRLAHGTGTLAVGPMAMAYRIFPGHVLQLTVPHDQAAWFRDGNQVKATSRLRLEGSPMQLRRVVAAGNAQEAVLHRLE